MLAVELNLRRRGSTHPFQLATILAGPGIDPDSGLLLDAERRPIFEEVGDAIARTQSRGL